MRPIANSSDKVVLYWIEMDIVDVSFEIFLVSDGVLPELALPKR